jgi:glycerol-3-phosphate dehydrogenase (NAD(P)+)
VRDGNAGRLTLGAYGGQLGSEIETVGWERVSTKIAVIGAGSWGTTVADILSSRVRTVLWARRPELAAQIGQGHENRDYLPGIALSSSLEATDSIGEAVSGASLVVMAVPSHGFRGVLSDLAPHADGDVPVLSLTKGLEQDTQLRMTEVTEQVLPGHVRGVLSGPNLAKEIAAGQPAATVVSMTDMDVALWVQELLLTDSLRVYTNPDLIGCEISGATKNVLAIGSGIADGLGLGESSRAALITRGLTELGRLELALGGQLVTLGGLAGVGDLIATCTSPLSRNRMVGVELGRGRSLSEIVGATRMVAEGVNTARPLLEMAEAHGVEMPIGEQVAAVLEGAVSPSQAIESLMRRSAKPEFPLAIRRHSTSHKKVGR